MGKMSLMEVLGSLYDFPKNETDAVKAEQQLEEINEAVEERPELKDIVSQLEARYEAKAEQKDEEITPLPPEVEKFLRELGNPFNRNEGI